MRSTIVSTTLAAIIFEDRLDRRGWLYRLCWRGWKITRGEAKVDGKYYYFQPETGQLYTGWLTLDGVEYCFDETGHPRTGTYQEDGKTWELDSDGRVKGRLNGWKRWRAS